MFDICIVGGGMVGTATSIGLAKLGFSIVLVEPNMPQTFAMSQPPDIRVSAISLTSEKLLRSLGAWTNIQNMRLCPYKRLSVWDNPRCRTDFDCTALNQPHLGHIIENRLVQLGLHSVIPTQLNISVVENAKIIDIVSDEHASITLDNDQVLQAKMLIGADGGQSFVRNAANIGVQGWQYSQHAMGILVKTNESQQDITWQQFTPEGPIAFLPLYDGFASLVWYNNPQKIRYLKALSKAQLKRQILEHFPRELVDFEVLDMASFPLTRMHANQYFKGHTLLIGDAAHTINPLAGQGVNLGFKDVATLLDVFAEKLKTYDRQTLLSPTKLTECFQQYEKARRRDNLMMMSAMDLLYGTFSNDNPPLKLLRNIGLKLANHTGPIKRQAMKYAMGLS